MLKRNCEVSFFFSSSPLHDSVPRAFRGFRRCHANLRLQVPRGRSVKRDTGPGQNQKQGGGAGAGLS